jgi:hypothetical protein
LPTDLFLIATLPNNNNACGSCKFLSSVVQTVGIFAAPSEHSRYSASTSYRCYTGNWMPLEIVCARRRTLTCALCVFPFNFCTRQERTPGKDVVTKRTRRQQENQGSTTRAMVEVATAETRQETRNSTFIKFTATRLTQGKAAHQISWTEVEEFFTCSTLPNRRLRPVDFLPSHTWRQEEEEANVHCQQSRN